MSDTVTRKLYVLQRASAMLLGPLVIVHLVLILYAVKGGLSAEEILGRTRDSIGWGIFYTVFVVAVAVHGPIGVRNVLIEWTSLSPRLINIFALLLCVFFLAAGLRAVVAVV